MTSPGVVSIRVKKGSGGWVKRDERLPAMWRQVPFWFEDEDSACFGFGYIDETGHFWDLVTRREVFIASLTKWFDLPDAETKS